MHHLKRVTHLILCFCAMILSACSADAPLEPAADLQISSTLSNQRISSITQDSLGYIWMGTYRGLNRYNGHEMHQFFCDDESHSIPDNQVWDVFTDRQGRVWVATKNGVAYYTERQGFQHVHLADASRLCEGFVQNHAGDIFLLQADQVLRYDSLAVSFEAVIQGLGTTSYLNNSMYIDEDDKLWVVCDNRISSYSSYTFSGHDTIDCADWTITSSCLYGDQLWLSHQNELRIFDVNRHQWLEVPAVFSHHPEFRSAFVECMQPMPQGRMLLGTRNGMFEYDPVGQTLIHQSEAAFPFEAPPFVVTRIFCDDKPNLWLCSASQGFVVRTQNTRRFNSDSYLRTAFSGIPVASVALDDKQNLWVGTQTNGLYAYDLQSHTVCHYDLPDPLASIQGDQLHIYSVMVDSQGDVWVSCTPNGVMQLRPQGRSLQYVQGYNLPNPIAIGEDQEGTIWIGTYSNLYYSHRQGDTHVEEHHIPASNPTYTSCLMPLADGRMAALTKSQGLRFIDSERMEMLPPVFSDSLLAACISRSTFLPTSLLQDKAGNLWIGTVSNGLLYYDIGQGQLKAIAGASCNDISSIEQGTDGNLWISTQDGLCKLDTETLEFTSYYESDGIGGNEFYDRCSCRLPDGTLVFGGAHGLTVFNPFDLQEELTPRLYFENLKVNNRIVRPWQNQGIDRSMQTATEVHLNHDQTNFALSFAVPDYCGSERYNYQYQLEGFNRQWVEANTSREAFYANLSPGRYTFRVRATSKDQHRMVERSLPIVIAPAPWATWWARLIYGCIAAALLIYIIRLMQRNRTERRTRLLSEREKEHERRINRMNMNFFANVSHEFRTPLTVIAAPIKQLIASNQELRERDEEWGAKNEELLRIVQRSVNRMLRLVNQMMDFHKLEDDALRLEVRRQDIIGLLRQSAEVFSLQAAEKCIELRTLGMEDDYLLWIDADKVEKIIYNLLGNAIKYTPAGGRIDLTFDATPQQVRFAVADTGQGIPEDQQAKIFERYYQLRRQEQGQFNWGTGIGLYYAQKLAHLHHGHITVSNRKEGSGAIFTVCLPASESAYSDEEKTLLQPTQQALFPLDSPNENSSTSTPSPAEAPTVLVIDDDAEIVHYVKALLSSRYRVIGCFDADAGLEALQQKAPDIILCDVMMPGRNGLELCHQVKNDLQLCHIPVVLLTAKTTTSDQVQGLGTGADAYVTKPFDPAYLLALVDSILSNRLKVRHLLAANTQTETLEDIGDNVLSPQDKAFMAELYNIMEQELANPDLDVGHITGMLHVSRSKLYYKIKGLTGENPSVFFRRYKLNRAAEMLREGRYNVSEISLLTGFSTLSHFSTSFKRHFGVTPSEFQ